ncbi:MAG: AAA family ATPase [Chloroflexi bacterium]|nr:AAA family ATPase [Chloroflexota bacterium]
MIRRIKVQGYKSLKDVDIELRPLTVILGPNAAGKSNLLDALALVSRMATRKTLKEAFQEHRGAPLEAFYYGEKGREGLLGEATAGFSIEVEVEISREVREYTEQTIKEMRAGLPPEDQGARVARRRVLANRLCYSLAVEMTTSTGHLRVADEKLEALTGGGRKPTRRRPFIEKGEDGRLHLRMEGQAHPSYHQLGLDHTLLSTPLYAPHYPHITALKEELSRWRFYYLEPNEMRRETPLKEVENISPFGSDLAGFYNSLKAKNERQFDALNLAIRQLIPAIDKVDVERTKEGFLQLQVWEHGVPFSSRVISEGTLRVLALVAITNSLSPASVIGCEEPENGVHPRRMRLIAELLKDAASRGETQIIVNTHSPILPEYFFEDAYVLVCTKGNHATRFQRLDTFGPLFRKRDVEDALDREPEPSTLADRILRGDFGG